MSKPRPIHTTIHSRDLRLAPDESEPSYSYEQESFLPREEDDVEDEFHRRLAGSSRRSDSSAASGGGGGGSGGPPGSFWRTDTPNWSNQGPSFSSVQIKPAKDVVTVNERKSSGGLLGAALQLHSQSEISQEPAPSTVSKIGWGMGQRETVV